VLIFSNVVSIVVYYILGIFVESNRKLDWNRWRNCSADPSSLRKIQISATWNRSIGVVLVIPVVSITLSRSLFKFWFEFHLNCLCFFFFFYLKWKCVCVTLLLFVRQSEAQPVFVFVCLFVCFQSWFSFQGNEINECHLVVEGIRDQFCAQFHPEKFKQQNLNGWNWKMEERVGERKSNIFDFSCLW
jgi:hypothetical protein